MQLSKKALFSLATLLVQALSVQAQGGEATAPEDSSVVKLNAETFNEFIKENPLVMAEFFAPWCGHCKNLAPQYVDAAAQLESRNIPLAQVDCTENDELCLEHGIRGYPTIKVFKDGNVTHPTDYEGQRSAGAIVKFMVKNSLPPVQVLSTQDELLAALNETVAPVIVDSGVEGYNETFYSVAKGLSMDYTFISFPDSKAKSKLTLYLPKDQAITKDTEDILEKFEKIEFDGDFKKLVKDEEITSNWIKAEAVPYFTDLNGDNYKSFFEAGIPLAYLFYNDEEELQQYIPIMTKISKANRGKMNFVHLDSKRYGRFAENLNMKQQFPAFAIQDFEANLKYGLPQLSEEEFEKIKEPAQFTEKELSKLVKDVLKGSAEPIVKSEEIPETQDSPVIKIVAKNHDEIVNDSSKDVLVKYYAPWCGHCKRMAPVYQELADIYASDKKLKDKVVIAEMNGELNDVASVKIEGYPTLILYPAGKNSEPVEFSGARDLETFINFIKENGKNSVDGNEALTSLREEQEKAKAKEEEEALDLDLDNDDEDVEDELENDEL
ncbi:hypothetical protein TBLA_0A05040 [Henningerozyma blattae CBS 6284]|uniref:Protein disulfide-isomerase n=1 Tax=Henningerozyma blattae (strain ATCC 34711 / CBS 6284 / DSM 70876 / NBRC 10599 / NRRL Y-10934 / UCD 77-7) TaxID=1071380 RepID=I2GVZ5_HENB6|nr:hypothetical protein TBLA_0A05040 [Tetrapisispora blattae CBS 6284]CCH58297.1 hypothetical protein TBLA_0A05040 [Tetrapisispora blattae CBS 6284]